MHASALAPCRAPVSRLLVLLAAQIESAMSGDAPTVLYVAPAPAPALAVSVSKEVVAVTVARPEASVILPLQTYPSPCLAPRSSNLPPPCAYSPAVSQLRRQAPAAPAPLRAAGGGTKVPVPRARKEPKKDGEGAAPKGARWKQVAALVGATPASPPPESVMTVDQGPLGGWYECAGGGLLWRPPSECVSEPAATLSSPKDGFHTELVVPGATRPPTAAPDPPTQAWFPLPQPPPPLLTKSVQPLSCSPSAQLVAPGSSSSAPHPAGALLAVAVGTCSGGAVGSGAV